MAILKLLNAFICGTSYAASLVLRKPVVLGIPPCIGIELTNCCNLACPECASGSGNMKRPKGYMDPGLFTDILNQLGKTLLFCNLYFQGEPLLHPEFPSFLDKARNIYKTISTNGHFLTIPLSEAIVKSGRGKIIISMDGMDQDTYTRYRRNGNLDKVKEGIMNISEAKKKFRSNFRIEVQMLVNRFNEHQIDEFRNFAKEKGVIPILKSMQINNSEAYNSWLPVQENYRRYTGKKGDFRIKSSLPDRCGRLWFVPVVTWDGKVLPCCFDKDADYTMGNLGECSFREIWRGEKYDIFRRNILSARRRIDICRNCTSGLTL